ncbi:ribosomal-protein-alanine N-acetyltransferase [Fictibacillus aquaticus]|jgi:ribosomal-protein-alanine N-acetyltransferase|uniref:[Ribosomal protein bS18]-alanine N-acetyltransferase n=2 Tax=Fictibacillus aquaticus TaxID=2021314 RepID=A0A235F5B5_9BACL|nr:ribosomal-protein-alanine N-acetyltransferase [Fictibacillus aquaticus]
MENITYRMAKISDIEDIVGIEQCSFATPWTAEAFHNEIVGNQFAHYMLIEENFQTIGYCGVWVVMDEAHITNIAILPEHRGRKLGVALLEQVMKLAKRYGAATMTLEVRLTNTPARKLYEKLGFQNGGIRKNYYSDNGEDALVMWVEL